MAQFAAFTPVTAARTRAARKVLGTPHLLTKYVAVGGLKEDLQGIAGAGARAEAANAAQSQGFASGKVATGAVLEDFSSVQSEYGNVMAALAAVVGDLQRAGRADLATRARQIKKNEATLHIARVESDEGQVKKARRSEAQEALRAEIHKDMVALLEFDEARAALERRKITRARLNALKTAAEKLAGKLADRTHTKGANKDVTAQERAAVSEQSDFWGSCYRMLQLTAEDDAGLAALLKAGARTR